MAHLQQYVPLTTVEDEEVDPWDGETVKIFIDNFHYILFGGDQLTVERAIGAKNSKKNENRGLEQLEGLVPVIEDWHAKVCMLKVCHFILKAFKINFIINRPYGRSCITLLQEEIVVLCISSVILL